MGKKLFFLLFVILVINVCAMDRAQDRLEVVDAKPVVNPAAKTKVLVYHYIGRGGTIESVKKHGLLTMTELFGRKLIPAVPCYPRWLMDDQYDVIYFKPLLKAPNNIKNMVAYYVDPDTTYVYNMEYRFDNVPYKYQRSKLLLRTYLENLELAQKMQAQRPPYKVVIFDPYTAKPFYVSVDDKRYSGSSLDARLHVDERLHVDNSKHYLYLAEVIIAQDQIKPEDLIFFEEPKSYL